jgi:hypothetical protein
MITELPSAPEVGLRLLMLGGGIVTVKATPLLAIPPTVTTTLPDVALAGTGTTMLEAVQLEGVATVLLNVTELVPCVPPKFAPEIVTEVPTTPDVGLTLVMFGPSPPVPPMFRKAAICMIHCWVLSRLAVAL